MGGGENGGAVEFLGGRTFQFGPAVPFRKTYSKKAPVKTRGAFDGGRGGGGGENGVFKAGGRSRGPFLEGTVMGGGAGGGFPAREFGLAGGGTAGKVVFLPGPPRGHEKKNQCPQRMFVRVLLAFSGGGGGDGKAFARFRGSARAGVFF